MTARIGKSVRRLMCAVILANKGVKMIMEHNVKAYETEGDALKEFFRASGQAVDSTHLTDSVTMQYEFSEEFLHTLGDLLGFCAEKGTDTLEITFNNPEKYTYKWSVEMTFKVDTESDEPSKQQEFFRQAGQAVDSTHLTDSVTMLTKEGFELRHEVFLHDAPTSEPTPEEPTEPTE